MYDLLNLEITCFLKVVKVDKFLNSSSRPFQNLMAEGRNVSPIIRKRDVSIISQRII